MLEEPYKLKVMECNLGMYVSAGVVKKTYPLSFIIMM